jgi:hypothetical protein
MTDLSEQGKEVSEGGSETKRIELRREMRVIKGLQG